jgi:predicted AlkP superfamily phosphohydrolase/phosphomutase
MNARRRGSICPPPGAGHGPLHCIPLALAGALLGPATAAAYDWRGAGPAAAALILVLFLAGFYLVFAVIVGPLRRLRKSLKARRAYENARFDRVVIVGIDGMDPELATRWMRQGKLPHLARLAKMGTFRPLSTTHPPASLVAWSSFLTGVNPGKHNIFDVVSRDRHTYRPCVSSARVLIPGRRRFPWIRREPLEVKALRKSRPFWHLLGEAGIASSILRVPATFPPEEFNGVLLAGQGVPDLRGTQGTSSLFTSRDGSGGRQEGCAVLPLVQESDSWRGELPGPENPFSRDESADLTLAFRLIPETTAAGAMGRRAVVEMDGQRIALRIGKYSEWIPVRYRARRGARLDGICRMYLKSLQPVVELYATPVQIDPCRPAMLVSHPADYSVRLGELYGPFATLGLAEDTAALDHGALDEKAFLEQCYQVHAERERIFFDELEKTPRGLCAGVFDICDRVQHMFWRRLEPRREQAEPPEPTAIELLYLRLDALVGRVLEGAGKDALVMVVSAHGCKLFRRSFNLNAWLHQHGYLTLVSGSTVSEEGFRQVDWQRTRAYGLGFNGLYLNRAGRERHGTVQPGAEADALLRELRERLRALRDPANEQAVLRDVYEPWEVYEGPYSENAPDLLLGYAPGFGPAPEAVSGAVMGEVFRENTRAWSGDHACDPRDVPGVLFANRVIRGEEHSIVDVAPTILQLFGLPVPRYMDGKPWVVRTEPAPPRPPGPAPGPL